MLREGDFERLQALFPRAGPSTVIRQIVARTVDAFEAELAEKNFREMSSDERIQQIVREVSLTTDPLDVESVGGGDAEEPDGVVRSAS